MKGERRNSGARFFFVNSIDWQPQQNINTTNKHRSFGLDLYGES